MLHPPMLLLLLARVLLLLLLRLALKAEVLHSLLVLVKWNRGQHSEGPERQRWCS